MASGKDLSFQGNDATLRAHFAAPHGDGPYPGLVLIPDVRGLYDHYRDLAARFAREGFATLALDIYSREGTPDLPDMGAVFLRIASLPDARVLADVESARKHLASLPSVRASAIGVTGFCLGGQYALMAACTLEGFAASVSWYGMLRYRETNALKPASPLDVAHRLSCPYLGLFGRDDALIPLADVKELERRLAGVPHAVEITTYAGAGHAFFNDTRPEMYRPDAAKDAWPRAVTFLRRHVGGDHAGANQAGRS